jgi:predicted PurR-regulated permease PerM
LYRVIKRNWLFWFALAVVTLVFVYLIRGILLPFVIGILAAYFLDPAADKLEKKGLSRSVATAIIIGCFFILLLVFFVMVPPIIFDQLAGLVEALPEYAAALHAQYDTRLSQWLGTLPTAEVESIKQAAANSSGGVVKFLGDFAGGLFASGMVVVNALALFLITPVVAFYLLRDWDGLVAHFDTLLPRAHADTIRQQLVIIDATLAGFLRGQLNVCLLLGVFYAIGLSLAGLKFGILIGLLSGFLVIIPYAGAMFSAVLGVGIAFFQFDNYTDIGMVLGVFLLGQMLESYFLTPKLVGEKVGLHPVWIIFGMLAGGAILGFVGVLIAVPLTAVIGVLIRFATERYLQSSYYQGN